MTPTRQQLLFQLASFGWMHGGVDFFPKAVAENGFWPRFPTVAAVLFSCGEFRLRESWSPYDPFRRMLYMGRPALDVLAVARVWPLHTWMDRP